MKVRCSVPIFFSAVCVVASIVFSIFCIYLLLGERKEVGISFLSSDRLKIHDKSSGKYSAIKCNYDLTNKKGVQLFLKKLQKYRYGYSKLNLEKLFCVPLNGVEIFRNRSELVLEHVAGDLVEHLNATFYRSLLAERLNISETRQTLKIFELTVLRFFQSRSYYILRDQLCLVLDYFLFTEHYLKSIFQVVASAYAHMLIKDSFYVVRLKKSNDAFDLRLIFNHHNPNLNCLNNRTEFECLNDCLKDRHRLSKYFYNGNETGIVRLPGGLSNATMKKQVTRHESACFRRCEKQVCLVTDFQTKNFEDKLSNNSNNLIDSNNLIKVGFFEFRPLITNFSFWVQITGLTLSFFGLSCYNLAMKLTTNSLPQNKKIMNLLFKLLLWTVCVTVFLVLSKESVENYSRKNGDRTATTSIFYPYRPEMIGLVVCTPVDIIMTGKIDKLTFAELENGTNDAFNRTVNEIYLEYLNERYELNWTISKKVSLQVSF